MKSLISMYDKHITSNQIIQPHQQGIHSCCAQAEKEQQQDDFDLLFALDFIRDDKPKQR